MNGVRLTGGLGSWSFVPVIRSPFQRFCCSLSPGRFSCELALPALRVSLCSAGNGVMRPILSSSRALSLFCFTQSFPNEVCFTPLCVGQSSFHFRFLRFKDTKFAFKLLSVLLDLTLNRFEFECGAYLPLLLSLGPILYVSVCFPILNLKLL